MKLKEVEGSKTMVGVDGAIKRLLEELEKRKDHSVQSSLKSMEPNQISAILEGVDSYKERGRIKTLKRLLATALDSKLDESKNILQSQLHRGLSDPKYNVDLMRRIREIDNKRQYLSLLLR